MAFHGGTGSGEFPEFGAIFMSNRSTKEECLGRKLLGLPLAFADFVKSIRAGMLLFLFEHEARELYGVFEAVSDGSLDIVPHAFQSRGKKFPAQVRFDVIWSCHPLSESSFRDAISNNYYAAYKFKFGLCREQVHRLLCLFDSQRIAPQRTLTSPRVNKMHPTSPEKESLTGKLEVRGTLKMPDASLCVSFGKTHPLYAQSATSGGNATEQVAFSRTEPQELRHNVKNTEASPVLSETLDEYISLSPSYPSDSEGDLDDDEPTMEPKGLYSDTPEERRSVFSRLQLLPEAKVQDRKDKSKIVGEQLTEPTVFDPVPQLEQNISEVNDSIETIMENLELKHPSWIQAWKRGDLEPFHHGKKTANQKASAFSRLSFASHTAYDQEKAMNGASSMSALSNQYKARRARSYANAFFNHKEDVFERQAKRMRKY